MTTCSTCGAAFSHRYFRTCDACRKTKQVKRNKAKRGALVVKETFIDPWLAVCERCPHPECVRPEGALNESSIKNYAADNPVWLCPKTKAGLRGWNAEQAIEGAVMLGLLEPVRWGEL